MAAFAEAYAETSPEDFTVCVFCRDAERSTKLLTCCHAVCDTCLTTAGVREGKVKCEQCPTVTRLLDNQGKHISLGPNDFQQVWASFLHLLEAKPCISCAAQGKNMMGTHVCLDCGEDYFCKVCLTIHSAVSSTKHHKPVPIPNLKDEEWSKQLRARHHESCGVHNAVMKFYCLVCKTLVCNDCLLLEHLEHKRISISELCNGERQKLEKLCKDLDEQFHYATWQKTELDKLVEKSRVDEDACVNEIAERVEAMKKMLDKWGQKKSEEAKNFYQNSRHQYETDATLWEEASILLWNVSNFNKLYLQYASDNDFFKAINAPRNIIGDVLYRGLHAGPLLKYKTQMYQWKRLGDIEVKLDELIGTASETEYLVVKTTNFFKCPDQKAITGLALTKEQGILTTGPQRDGVLVFNSNGSYINTIKFQEPISASDVASCGSEVYVSDCKLRQVKRINGEGKTTHTISLRGNASSKDKKDSIGLNVDAHSGLMYMTSARRNTVYRCAVDDDVAEPLISLDSEPPLKLPHYLTYTHTCDIVVTNAGGHNVNIYDADGKPKRILGVRGEGVSQFNRPMGVGMDSSGCIYVADEANHRVQVIAPDGTFLGSFPRDGGETLKDPHAVIVNGKEDVLVSHSRNTISVFRPIRRLTRTS